MCMIMRILDCQNKHLETHWRPDRMHSKMVQHWWQTCLWCHTIIGWKLSINTLNTQIHTTIAEIWCPQDLGVGAKKYEQIWISLFGINRVIHITMRHGLVLLHNPMLDRAPCTQFCVDRNNLNIVCLRDFSHLEHPIYSNMEKLSYYWRPQTDSRFINDELNINNSLRPGVA